VSFALILIAIALVFSTTLFTASVGSSGTVETVADGTGTEQSVEHTTEGLLKRVNQQNDWLLTHNRTFLDRSESNLGKLQTQLNKNLTTYDRQLSESKAASGPTYVNVSSNGLREGTRIKQDSIGPLTSTGFSNRSMDEFVMLIRANSDSTDESALLVVSGADGETSRVEINSSDDDVTVSSGEDPGSMSLDCSYSSPDSGTVYLDLSNGFATPDTFDPEAQTQDCPDRFTDGLTAPYDLTLVGSGLEGAYEFTVAEPGFSRPGLTDSPIIWSTDIDIVYETSAVTRESETEVSGYDP